MFFINKLMRMNLYDKKPVDKLLFEGYDDPILSTLQIPKFILDRVSKILKELPDRFPGYLPVNSLFIFHRFYR